jgi:hypothetical protein
MILKQLSIFVNNQTGRLCDITKIIASNGINLRALCLVESTHRGILRMIADDSPAAQAKLEAAGLGVWADDVIAVKMDDHPGSLSGILEVLAQYEIGVEYLYAFLAAEQGTAYVALCVQPGAEQKAVDGLTAAGYTGFSF